MFHTLYRIVNITNNRLYIGVHSTNNLDDGYLGSGYILRLAIEKYGKENFKKDILCILPSRKMAYEFERTIVNKEFIERNNTYNLVCGGDGSPPGEDAWSYGMKHSEETKKRLSKLKLGVKRPNMMGENHPLFGIGHTEETKKKMSENMKGSNHHMFGKKRPEHAQKILGTKRPDQSERIKGKNNPNAKKVLHIKSGQVFPTIKAACENFSTVKVSDHCRGFVKNPEFKYYST